MLRIRLAAAASIAALLAANAVNAADASDEEIRIAFAAAPTDVIYVEGDYRAVRNSSAVKTPTPVLDIPQAISVLSRDQIDDQGFVDFGDVLRYTPGASIGQGEGHRDQITIRGQNTTADFFIDGLRDDVQYFRSFYNLDRIEILKGSNALMFGRGGGGGVINRVTKVPSLDDRFLGTALSADTFGSVNISADANQTLSDNAAFRLNAFYESLANHRDFFDGDRYAINPTISAELSPSTYFSASYEYVNDDRVVDRGVPSLNGVPLRGFDNAFFGSPDENLTTFEAHIVRGHLEHDFSNALTFNATVQYADYEKLYQNLYPVGFDDVAGTVSLDGYRDTTVRQNFIAQANLIGEVDTGPITHTLLIGAEYGDQSTENARRDILFADSNDDQISFVFSDPLAIPAFSFPVSTRDRASDVSFFSAYAQDQIAIGDHIIVVAGVRYDRFDIDVVDQIEIANGTLDGNDGLLGRIDEEVSPRVGLIYKPAPQASLYASYSRSFLPRSGDQFLTLSLSSEALAPEQFDNYEVGLKWDFTDDLSFTAALFQLDRENGSTVDPDDPGQTILTGSRTRGLEIQMIGELLPRWRINGGYSYLDAVERGRVVGRVLANRTLAQVPEHMFSLWNRYDATDRLAFGLGVTHQSSQFTSIGNSVELPAFTRVDAAAYFTIKEGLELQVNLENLLDTDYFPAAHNDNNITTGEPINARFTLRGTF